MNAIKVLIELNEQKFTICVVDNSHHLTIKSVLDQLNQQHKQLVHLDTHSVEIFDHQINQFICMATDDDIIGNLARLRVKKRDNNQIMNNELTTNQQKVEYLSTKNDLSVHKMSTTKQTLNDFEINDFDDITNYMLKKRSNSENNVFNGNNDLVSDKTVDKLIGDRSGDHNVGKDDTIKAKTYNGNKGVIQKRNFINYLDIELTSVYKMTTDLPHLHYKTYETKIDCMSVIAIRFRAIDYDSICLLIDLLDINRRCFQMNASNSSADVSLKWITISIQMVNNGFKKWSPDKCRDAFRSALNLYKRTLNSCPDLNTANKVNPLFSTFYWFDLKFIVNLREFNEIRDLRQEFNRKLQNSRRFKSVSRKYPSNVSLNISFSVNDHKIHNRFNSNHSLTSNRSDFDRNYRNNVQANRGRDLAYSKASMKTASNDTGKMKKISNLPKTQIIEFKALAKSITTITGKFGGITKATNFWQLVSNQMFVNGFKHFDSDTCYLIFREFVCDYYGLVLKLSKSYKNAVKTFELFPLIHAMDLQPCLTYQSFDRIKKLRDDFANYTRPINFTYFY
ncbi:uncharacterized protein LOC128951237 [Oppia nitens]|uniref:uncharacterized protein LOC128951237 n=1 Tax=Oppia nitens TaxID=1686743 RepID=UPI0023DB68F5|nr:uncharacterized protein LOC128951237 [Oppia nitens]